MRSIRVTRRIFTYLRSDASRPRGAGGAVESGGLMIGTTLLEDPRDDLLQGRVVDAHVADLVGVEDGAEYLRDPAPLHLDVGLGPVGPHDLAIPIEVLRRRVGE